MKSPAYASLHSRCTVIGVGEVVVINFRREADGEGRHTLSNVEIGCSQRTIFGLHPLNRGGLNLPPSTRCFFIIYNVNSFQMRGAYKAASVLVEKLLNEAMSLREQLHLRTVRLLCLFKLGRLTLARAKLKEVGEPGRLDVEPYLKIVDGVTCTASLFFFTLA